MQCMTCVCAHLCVYVWVCGQWGFFCACWCSGDSQRPLQWQDNSSGGALCSNAGRFPSRWVLIVWLPETNPECLPENQTTGHRVQLHERIPLCFSLLIRLSGQGWRRRLVAVLRDTCQSAREEAAAPRGDNRGHEIISVVTNGPYLRLMSAPRKPPSSQLISPSLRLVLSCHRSFGVPSLPITSSDIMSGLIGGWLHLFGVLSE